MWKVALIVIMSVVGWASLTGAQAMANDDGTRSGAAVAVSQEAPFSSVTAEQRDGWVRICFGPARIDLGGTPFTRLAFGGEGCGRPVSPTFAIRIGDQRGIAQAATAATTVNADTPARTWVAAAL